MFSTCSVTGYDLLGSFTALIPGVYYAVHQHFLLNEVHQFLNIHVYGTSILHKIEIMTYTSLDTLADKI